MSFRPRDPAQDVEDILLLPENIAVGAGNVNGELFGEAPESQLVPAVAFEKVQNILGPLCNALGVLVSINAPVCRQMGSTA